MSVVCFHLDEDCQAASLASAMRQHGADVTTTNELGIAGVHDEDQLQQATDKGHGRLIGPVAWSGQLYKPEAQEGFLRNSLACASGLYLNQDTD